MTCLLGFNHDFSKWYTQRKIPDPKAPAFLKRVCKACKTEQWKDWDPYFPFKKIKTAKPDDFQKQRFVNWLRHYQISSKELNLRFECYSHTLMTAVEGKNLFIQLSALEDPYAVVSFDDMPEFSSAPYRVSYPFELKRFEFIVESTTGLSGYLILYSSQKWHTYEEERILVGETWMDAVFLPDSPGVLYENIRSIEIPLC